MLRSIYYILAHLLEWLVIFFMVLLTVVVIVGVTYRIVGNSLSWYDEIASVLLAWITYFGAGLAALKRRHIGFDAALLSIPMPMRMVGVAIAEISTIVFFAIMTWAGLKVLQVLEGEVLVSLTWLPIQVTQAIIPIGGALFIACSILSLPDYWRKTAAGISLEHADIEEEVETELKKAGEAS
ncbi:MAG: TRAP transporter small permease subunit [Rhizobiales bacterium]|nr:TRAP transporter small permease subunit [Hyphomicrobiales bacterium]